VSEREEGYMQQHLCECFIDLMGEKLQIQWKGFPDLIPWPEIAVLMELHGEQSVYDIRPVALGARETALREKERMSLKYGRDAVEKVYAGKSFNMEWFMPGWPIDPVKKKGKGQNARPERVQFRKPDDDDAADARI
jgi:hypothetical protein